MKTCLYNISPLNYMTCIYHYLPFGYVTCLCKISLISSFACLLTFFSFFAWICSFALLDSWERWKTILKRMLGIKTSRTTFNAILGPFSISSSRDILVLGRLSCQFSHAMEIQILGTNDKQNKMLAFKEYFEYIRFITPVIEQDMNLKPSFAGEELWWMFCLGDCGFYCCIVLNLNAFGGWRCIF